MIIVLLGSHAGPIPSAEHLQKEMFVLTKANPKLAPLFRFESHYKGPYSARLGEASLEPLHYGNAFEVGRRGSIRLAAAGQQAYDDMAARAPNGTKLRDLINVANLTRHIYDKLTVDELLFLVCDFYPEHTDLSNVQDRYKSPATRRRLADSLLKKEIITQERHEELIAGG